VLIVELNLKNFLDLLDMVPHICTSNIGRLKQKDQEFKTSLNYIVTLSQNEKKKRKTKQKTKSKTKKSKTNLTLSYFQK
jgi:hypothetical protein